MSTMSKAIETGHLESLVEKTTDEINKTMEDLQSTFAELQKFQNTQTDKMDKIDGRIEAVEELDGELADQEKDELVRDLREQKEQAEKDYRSKVVELEDRRSDLAKKVRTLEGKREMFQEMLEEAGSE